MKYINEFRSKKSVDIIVFRIAKAVRGDKNYVFMEVCGTHTMAAFRFGIRELLPRNVKLISGPGCPVCVTGNEYIDKAIAIAHKKDIIITTFGDMMRVPGSYSSLYEARSEGCDIRMVYSTDDALGIAVKNPEKEVVFLGVGFETTAPIIAASILMAEEKDITNYSVLCANKTIPEAMEALINDNNIKIDGFLLPGHVSAITGSSAFNFLAKRYGMNCVVAGFEAVDILQAIYLLINQDVPKVDIEYSRVAEEKGNKIALKILDKVFDKVPAYWRGIGEIKDSGYKIKRSFQQFDAEIKHKPCIKSVKYPRGCICGDVLKGVRIPNDCKLFGSICVPDNPKGACMVSSEGTCAAYYKYGFCK